MKNLINNVNRKLARKHSKGFSLVELLVVIAVIGVIAAIAIPAMSGIFENSRSAKVKRNAQSLASIYASARAAGASFSAYDKDSVITTLTSTNGITGEGAFKTSVFKVPMSAEEITSVKGSTILVGNPTTGGTALNFRLEYTGSETNP